RFLTDAPSALVPTPTPLRSTLFPYTTLFRSSDAGKTRSEGDALIAAARCGRRAGATGMTSACPPFVVSRAYECLTVMVLSTRSRSEEHTSELQSRGHLVCRLLLEKKNRDIDE